MSKPLDIAVMFDSPEENWPSMDLVGEMLFRQWRSNPAHNVRPSRVSIGIPPVFRRLPWLQAKTAFNADRTLARYVSYPARALATRPRRGYFHVVDHSYAQLTYALPAARTGVFCHDLDLFRPLLYPAEQHPLWFRTLAKVLLRGMRSAAVVFHSTSEVGRGLERHGLVSPSRLVLAPFGVAPEFTPVPDPADGSHEVLSGATKHPFLLHVGSGIDRKRLDVLFEVFARVRASHPGLRLVQQGATLSTRQRDQVDRLGIGDALLQPPKLDRSALAALYRRAAVVLVTSDSEGFGVPVIEAMACGAIVVASDIPVLREVGGPAALYAPVGDAPAWAALVDQLLAGRADVPPKAVRVARAGEFTWERHAGTILAAYQEIAATGFLEKEAKGDLRPST